MSNTVLKIFICALIAALAAGICTVCILIGRNSTPSHSGAHFLSIAGVCYGQKN